MLLPCTYPYTSQVDLVLLLYKDSVAFHLSHYHLNWMRIVDQLYRLPSEGEGREEKMKRFMFKIVSCLMLKTIAIFVFFFLPCV